MYKQTQTLVPAYNQEKKTYNPVRFQLGGITMSQDAVSRLKGFDLIWLAVSHWKASQEVKSVHFSTDLLQPLGV